MPFGLCNAPATFQRLMHSVLHGLVNKVCLIYLDDIIVFGKSSQEHLDNLKLVLDRLGEAGLKIKPKKCTLMCKEVAYLGHIISPEGISPNPKKVQTVLDWPVPRTVKEVQSFLGFTNYYRRFIKNFSQIARPLHALTKKSVPFSWSDAEQTAFNTLKHLTATSPVLQHPDYSKRFILDTDACLSGLGAVFSQLNTDGKEMPVAFASRSTSPSERSYPTTRLEMLAIVWALDHFRPYLLHAPFTIRTDHSSLTWLYSFKSPSGQLARWLEKLTEYHFTVEYRPGKSHANADALSRIPRPPPSPPPAPCSRLTSHSRFPRNKPPYSRPSPSSANVATPVATSEPQASPITGTPQQEMFRPVAVSEPQVPPNTGSFHDSMLHANLSPVEISESQVPRSTGSFFAPMDETTMLATRHFSLQVHEGSDAGPAKQQHVSVNSINLHTDQEAFATATANDADLRTVMYRLRENAGRFMPGDNRTVRSLLEFSSLLSIVDGILYKSANGKLSAVVPPFPSAFCPSASS